MANTPKKYRPKADNLYNDTQGKTPMYMEDLKDRKEGEDELPGVDELMSKADKGIVLWWDAKRVLVGAGARAFFYPTLMYNVFRNKIQAEFRWWDWIDEFVLLGAVPFPSDVLRLKELGVCGVVTLNESYETLVPSSLYEAHGIHHLVLPTQDYLFAPSLVDICRAVDFIHENASHRRSTYIHCKAGRGRSTTIVICYLVKYRQMMPDAAYDYVKSIRPRVLLASSQWKAVQEFYHLKVNTNSSSLLTSLFVSSPRCLAARDILGLDDCSFVVITEVDLDGYDPRNESGNKARADTNLIYQVKVAGEAALAKLSCLWLRCHSQQKISSEKLKSDGGCAVGARRLQNFTLDIHVFS
ncbi:putative dual specificity protein phosphatase DSP8 [Forsythia ovata]|uniref:phosphatidylglycerophosphatase n=1 Tax=Forsythia ovata TaxID=205694 RepID=A0ABD1RNL5_9LAMI